MTTHVYNARFLSEDTNPWDTNESYGVHTTLEGAQKALDDTFRPDEDEDCRWLEVGPSYTGTNPRARTWHRFTLHDGETWDDYAPDDYSDYPETSGYGLYVIEEELHRA